jgi:hydroxymethylpyrimidine/phosphomethylpyrimidine kinase
MLVGAELRTLEDVRAALPALLAFGSRAVLVTGGHLDGEPTDLFGDGARVIAYRAPRIAGELRGSGSLLCTAIAARLACGDPLEFAIATAREFVRAHIANAIAFAGMSVAY